MHHLTRREFGGATLALAAQAGNLFGVTGLDETLRASMKRHDIPVVVAAFATADHTLYTGAFGRRDAASQVDVTPGSIFAIASMTKAITSTAAMQLVEQGKVKLDEPASVHVPDLSKVQVLDGFDPKTGQPRLRPPKKPVTLRHLLSHTSGFAYNTWNGNETKYEQVTNGVGLRGAVAPLTPLVFEPGTGWQYGPSVDWAGRLVETISGLTLEQYFQRNILQPLGMKDTTFIFPEEQFDRLVGNYQRHADGSLTPLPRVQPAPPKAYNGGGGLYSTAPDYIRFTQMILRRGRGIGKDQILKPETVDMMATNQIGSLGAGKMKSFDADRSSDVDLHPGAVDKFGLGFLINPVAHDGGRSAGSVAWAGVDNTFYWIDPKRGVSGVIMMQLLPFCDKDALAVLGDFERDAYATLVPKAL